MKNNKLLTSLFVLGMGLSLVACGSSDGGTTTKKTDGTKTVEKKEEQKFAERKEYETEGLACNFKLPNLDSFYLVKGLEKPVYNTELSLGSTKYEVYDDYLPVLLVYVGDDAFAEWSDGYTIEELATKDLNGEAEYTETKVGGYRALVADLSDEDSLKKQYYIEHPDLPNGIVCIEVCEYDDKDISDELAEAIIKEFKVVELLDVE